MLYSTTAAYVLASLQLDLKKVNVESSIFIIEFENLTVSYFWLLICWWYFSFLQRLSKNVRYSVHNVNAYVNTFSFSFRLLLGENNFFMEYLRETALSRYPPEKLFRKFSKNSSESTLEAWRKSFFNDVTFCKLYKNTILTSMFSYKIWEFFRTTFPLKTLCFYLCMGSIYSVKMHLQNTSKILPKIYD